MNFTDILNVKSTEDETENGARCWNTTGSKVLDFFAIIGGMREANEGEIVRLYHEARKEDKELADKIILWVGSIREGQGERRIRRILMKELAKVDPNKAARNFDTFVDYFRFDDLYAFEDTPIEKEMWSYLNEKLVADVKAMNSRQPITLLSKWLKSINTSSEESRRLARKFCSINGWSEKSYRKTLAALRKYSNVVETKMSARKWECIDFEKVPSRAMMRYSDSFAKHSPERWEDYKEQLRNGTAKINSSTLYPYDIFEKMDELNVDLDLLQSQWDSLPNYFKEGRNILVMADVSGSMSGRPMNVSTSFALYCAQHNTGNYHNFCMTFTDRPRFFKFEEDEAIDSAYFRLTREVGFNTNLEGALLEIYAIAKETHDTPEALLIISDSEIDYFMSEGTCDSIIDKYVKKFAEIEVEFPKVIFWNVEARGQHYLDKMTNPYVGFVSGASATTFQDISNLLDYTPYESMIQILNRFNYI